MEVWKDIKGYEGIYQASTFGRIRSLDRVSQFMGRIRPIKGKIKKTSRINIRGHLGISFCKNGIENYFTVHRIILETFIGSCPEGMECRHLNGIATDNHIWNLAWGTPKENGQDRVKHGTSRRGITKPSIQGENHPNHKITNQQAVEIYCLFNIFKHSVTNLARHYKVDRNVIYGIICGATFKHLNFSIKYTGKKIKI